MREIKFRGKSVGHPIAKKGEWVYGYFAEMDGKPHILGRTAPEMFFSVFEVEENSIGQFTGFRDQYGQEIYEGDILHFNNGKDYNRHVLYRSGCFWMRDEDVNCTVPMRESDIEKWEIVGNVYD